jgi:hypothetical protein
MNKRSTTKLFLILLVAMLGLLALGQESLAQCSMCRASLAGSNNAAFIRNFNIGVLVLLVPPVAMFCSFFVILKRSKLKDDKTDSDVSR